MLSLQILQKQIQLYNQGGSNKLSIAPVFDKLFPERPEPGEGDVENVSMKVYLFTKHGDLWLVLVRGYFIRFWKI